MPVQEWCERVPRANGMRSGALVHLGGTRPEWQGAAHGSSIKRVLSAAKPRLVDLSIAAESVRQLQGQLNGRKLSERNSKRGQVADGRPAVKAVTCASTPKKSAALPHV
jgi:hypothetical protein